MFSMLIDQEKIQVVRTFIFRNKESLEFNKIEGVDIQQGPFGRVFNYGRLTISGVGIKQLRTEPIDRPDEVANEIRSLITRP
jgi:membrane protein YdbS with pleckstrin-like domain